MPLRDHFHPPLKNQRHPEGLHSVWINSILRQLVTKLPRRYFAEPEVRLGSKVEPDVTTFEGAGTLAVSSEPGNGAVALETAAWTAAPPSHSRAVETPARDVYELRVYDEARMPRVVAVIEMVSERNKDRPDARRDFALKCASYLQQQISVIVVDVVTSRQSELYGEILSLLSLQREEEWTSDPPVYAVALRTTKQGEGWRLDSWEETLSLGAALPTLPLWLASDLAVPVELEATYEETCKVLRIT